MTEPTVIVKRKPFDLDFYDWQVRVALNMNESDSVKRSKIKTLIQRAYEQGVMDARRDYDYFNDYGEA